MLYDYSVLKNAGKVEGLPVAARTELDRDVHLALKLEAGRQAVKVMLEGVKGNQSESKPNIGLAKNKANFCARTPKNAGRFCRKSKPIKANQSKSNQKEIWEPKGVNRSMN